MAMDFQMLSSLVVHNYVETVGIKTTLGDKVLILGKASLFEKDLTQEFYKRL